MIEFINTIGKPRKIHIDNGIEFSNTILESFCLKNNIKQIFGYPYHPQTQGCVESYNKEIKELLKIKYTENPKSFSIYLASPEIINIYNNNVLSSTKFSPKKLIKCTDVNLIRKVINNIKSSQNKYKNKINSIKDNSPCLLCENYE